MRNEVNKRSWWKEKVEEQKMHTSIQVKLTAHPLQLFVRLRELLGQNGILLNQRGRVVAKFLPHVAILVGAELPLLQSQFQLLDLIL